MCLLISCTYKEKKCVRKLFALNGSPRALTQTVHRPVALIPPPPLIELSVSEYCSPLVKLKSYGVCLADLGSEGSANMYLLFVYI